jgi:4-aminobutyrate aminotransferase-like enzyme
VANIEVLLEEKIVENSAARGEQLMAGLEKLKEKFPLIGDVRGKGLMIGIELVRDRGTKEPASGETAKLRGALREMGILVGKGGVYGNVLRIQPPLIITEEECNRLLEALEKVLKEV